MSRQQKSCVVCGGVAEPFFDDWVLRCKSCGMQSSTLQPNLHGEKVFSEDERLTGLGAIRRKNFERMLHHLCREVLSRPGSVLEIGPGHGFFLEAMKSRNWSITAIEPDTEMFNALKSQGWQVEQDIYPSASLANRTFDLIAFNDVLEHIPDVRETLSSVERQLSDQGFLLVNLPSANGSFYRLAHLLARLGWQGPFKRMWQFGYVSPHTHYFTPYHLRRLAGDFGLVEVAEGKLPILSFSGLKERINYSKESSTLEKLISYLASLILIPIATLLPSDITYHLFKRQRSPVARLKESEPAI